MKKDVYEVLKNVDKIYRGEATGFLTNSTRVSIEERLSKVNYNVFKPFEEAEKTILYKDKYPRVRLFKIICYKDEEIKHSSIMGSLFGLNITGEMFGDIIKYNDNFYVYVLDSISDLVLSEFKNVGNVYIKLEEVDVDYLNNFKREYERIELIVSSLRIDTVISRLIRCNRDLIFDKVKDKEIFVNDVCITKANGQLKLGDVFSIKRFGKFKFREILGNTKKDNYIIVIDKFV